MKINTASYYYTRIKDILILYDIIAYVYIWYYKVTYMYIEM